MAISLEFLPPSQKVVGGEPVMVDIGISGLGIGGPPTVGGLDLDVSFDPTILSPVGVIFGTFLGDPALGEALTTFTLLPGALGLAIVSLLPPEVLDARQPDSFVIASLVFSTLAVGVSPLIFSDFLVIDAFGRQLDGVPTEGSISKVAEPSALILIGSGLIGVLGARMRRLANPERGRRADR